jgi:PLP dependent protein
LADIRERVANAARASSRAPDEILLVAVSKQQSTDAIEAAWRAGVRHFAENYLQEALIKMAALSSLDIQWHFVGRIQSNKTRPIAEHFDWVHTVDRAKVAIRLNEQRDDHAAPLNVFVQVNQGREAQKAGAPVAEIEDLTRLVASLPRLKLRGLMSMPPGRGDPDRSAPYFEGLRELAAELGARGVEMDSLSMGTSADFETAIAHGATCLRIGAAIFGPRMPA